MSNQWRGVWEVQSVLRIAYYVCKTGSQRGARVSQRTAYYVLRSREGCGVREVTLATHCVLRIRIMSSGLLGREAYYVLRIRITYYGFERRSDA